ncbi:hypothetical protein T07_9174 [Trichinella nelsoni]|uniref:Uncharacterized protein n=1 Tax=Trichinella nelsoni TaxID=6336 RepID=A0A0V0RHJ9_9BILA|nr:hypothetical protein T07_9174 [Trichinella nelsoni]
MQIQVHPEIFNVYFRERNNSIPHFSCLQSDDRLQFFMTTCPWLMAQADSYLPSSDLGTQTHYVALCKWGSYFRSRRGDMFRASSEGFG